jgi:hypothetical protein
MEKLPPNLDLSLRAIHLNSDTPLNPAGIKKLLIAGYIKINYKGGWLTSSKGREYLKRHKS